MHYEDFFIQIHPLKGEDHPVTVHCPAGDGEGTFRVPLTPKDLEPEEVGGRLFEALFSERLRRLLAESLAGLPRDGEHGLRIKLCFDPEALQLGQLPWETLFWQERREFLALGRTTSLVRYLNIPRGVRPRLSSPLRVLLASACPLGTEELEVEAEAGRIRRDLQEIPGVRVQWLRNATPQGLRNKLHEEPFHIFHFMGHGSFKDHDGEGALLFEDEKRCQVPLSGRILAHLLRDFPSLQLAFLNACRSACSAEAPGLDPFAGVASALVLGGMPAVLAMQISILDEAAGRFSKTFYQRLIAGDPVDAATAEARMAMLLGDPGSAEWMAPVLFLRSWDGRLFEPATAAGSDVHDFSRLIRDKTEGFVGRRWIFDAIAQFTQKNPRGYFILRGDPGIGKTALMAELVKRERYPHHFNLRTEGIQRPEQFIRNIAAQVAATYGLEPSPLPADAAQSARFLNSLLDKVSARLQPGEKAALVVDALDETDLSLLAPGANTLYLPASLPAGFYVFVTSRRGDFPLHVQCEQEVCDIDPRSTHNLQDVRDYVESRLSSAGIRAYLTAQGLEDASFIEVVSERSEGNFMYLRHVLPEIEKGAYRGRDFRTLPAGLESYYEDHWRRMRSRDENEWFEFQLPVLVALTAFQEPISVDVITRFAGFSDRRRTMRTLQDWVQFLDVERSPDGKRFRLYHATFSEFVAEKDQVAEERVNLQEAHRRISEQLW